MDADGGFLQCTEYDCEKRTLSGTKLTKSKLKEKCDDDEATLKEKMMYISKIKKLKLHSPVTNLELCKD